MNEPRPASPEDEPIEPSKGRGFYEDEDEDEGAPDPDACPGCGCLPGDGLTDGCEAPEGCGYFRPWHEGR